MKVIVHRVLNGTALQFWARPDVLSKKARKHSLSPEQILGSAISAGAQRAEATVEQVVRQLLLIGFSDIRKVMSWRSSSPEPRRARTASP